MKFAVVLVLAYLTAAIYYVWRDFSERNLARMKPYVMSYRRTRDLGELLLAGLGWIIGAIANARFRGRLISAETAPIAVFLLAAAVFWVVAD
jgi:hypothetical protein